MYEVGEQIVYGCQGVYEVNDITHLDIGQEDRLYYVLTPVTSGTDKIYTPVDNKRIATRRILTKESAKAIIDKIPEIAELTVSNERQREQTYKEALKSADLSNWFSVIKTIYIRQKKRLEQGKKITALDERYLRNAENEAYNELSLVFGIPKDEIISTITSRFESTC